MLFRNFFIFLTIFLNIVFAGNLSSQSSYENMSKIVIIRTCKYPTSAYPINFLINSNEIEAPLKCMNPRKKLIHEIEVPSGKNEMIINFMMGLGKNRKVLVDIQGNRWESKKSIDVRPNETRYFVARWFQDSNSGIGAIFGALGAAIEESVEGKTRVGLYFEEQSKECILQNKGKNCLPLDPSERKVVENVKSEKNKEVYSSIEEQLTKLKELFDKGLISKEVYEKRQAIILDS